MIISHTYKYVFVELPRTGSTAIFRELRDYYDGVPILYKHATYYDFLKIATEEEKKYFVFSCIRNPLDDVVSIYFKYKSDHEGRYSDPAKRARNKGIGGYIDNKIFDFVQRNDTDFPAFFKKFYKVPYNRWASLSHKNFDFIIHFENLADDFAEALKRIGIEPKRPLPVVNRTGGKERDYVSYYTPETIGRAKRVFGPYMKQWGYQFPPEWGDVSVPWWNQMEFECCNLFRTLWWRYLKIYLWPPQIPRVSPEMPLSDSKAQNDSVI